MTTSIEDRLESLEKSVSALVDAVAKNARVKVEVELTKTDSGIQIAGGPTTIKKEGTLIGTTLLPAPNSPPGTMMMGAVIVLPDGSVGTVGPIEALKFIL